MSSTSCVRQSFGIRNIKLIFLLIFIQIPILIWNLGSTSSKLVQSTPVRNSAAAVFSKQPTSHHSKPIPLAHEIQYYSGKELPIPSIVLRPGGGIGNQLFMYSGIYALARRMNAPLFLQITETTGTENRKFSAIERKYVLDFFNLNNSFINYIKMDFELPEDDVFWFDEVNWFENTIPKNKILIANDYWESELFFKPCKAEIIPQFQMVQVPNKDSLGDIIQEIESSESVGVHIRRGDFVRRGANDRDMPLTYQTRAMKKLITLTGNKNLKFFIFSDSIEYVKSHLAQAAATVNFEINPNNIVYASKAGRTSIEEFYLLSLCKHIVTPNSTFSWWAAYLNRNVAKIIIAAFPRFKPQFYDIYVKEDVRKYKEYVYMNKSHIYPEGWITINPFVLND